MSSVVTSDANKAFLTVHSASGVVVVLLAVVALLGAAAQLNQAWQWSYHGQKVSVRVIGASESGVYQVEFDGIRANAELDRVHAIGDRVEVLFDPKRPHQLKSESDVITAMIQGLMLLALDVFLVGCLVADDRSQSRAVSVGASTSGSR